MIQLNFFATLEDLLPGIQIIDSLTNMKYIPCGHLPTREWPTYSSLAEMPAFDTAYASMTGFECILIVPAEVDIIPTAVLQSNGNEIYGIPPGEYLYKIEGYRNTEYAQFLIGGQWEQFGSQCLMGNRIVLDDSIRKNTDLFAPYKTILRYLCLDFLTIQSRSKEIWRVGPQAFQQLKNEVRLCPDHSHVEHYFSDLRMPYAYKPS